LMAELSNIYYELGNKAKAEKLFDSLKQRSRDEYVPSMLFSWIHKVRGNKDQAYEWLERACNEHDGLLIWFKITPVDRDRIPDVPRVKALLKKAGLE
ncbi:MAG: tol-pal system YbgF family protein, partial [Candidatus Hodarchaeota archaeon]